MFSFFFDKEKGEEERKKTTQQQEGEKKKNNNKKQTFLFLGPFKKRQKCPTTFEKLEKKNPEKIFVFSSPASSFSSLFSLPMKKLVERFILLNQFGERLLHRLFHTKKKWSGHSRNAILLFSDKNIHRVAEAATRRFPNELLELEKVSGHEEFVNNADDLVLITRPMYELSLDLLDWKKNAYTTLLQTSESFPSGLSLSTQPFLMRAFLSMVSLYCRVMILLSEISERRLVIAAHFLSLSIANANKQGQQVVELDPSTGSEIDHLFTFYNEPAKRLHEDFSPEKSPKFAHTVFFTISQLQNHLTVFHSVSELRRVSGLSLAQDQASLSLPALAEQSTEFPSFPDFRDGVVFSCVLAPEAFKEKDGVPLELLSLVLRHVSAVRLVRDEMFLAHSQLGSLFGRFKDGSGSFVLKRHRKLISSTLGESANGIGHTHRKKLRVYLVEELRNLVTILRDFPSLIPPKLPIILGALALSRDAIVQHYEHNHNPSSGSKVKKNDGVGAILVLIHFTVELVGIVEANKGEVQGYYGEYLRGQHCRSFLKHTGAEQSLFTDLERRVIQAMSDQLQTIDPSSTSCPFSSSSSYSLLSPSSPLSPPSLKALRLNWQRLELSFATSGVAAKIPRVMERGRWLSLHSRYWDEWTEVVRECSSFSLLWSYSKQVTTDFGHTLRNPGLTHCALSLFTVLHHFPGIATSGHADEKTSIAKFCVENAEQRCDELSFAAFQLIQEIWEQFQEWNDQTEPCGTATALLASLPDAKTDRKPPAPVASESDYHARSGLKAIEMKQTALIELLRAFHTHQAIIVFDFEFSPVEYFRRVLKQQWRDLIVKLAGGGGGRTCPVQVTRAERTINTLNYTLSWIESYVDLSLQKVFQEVWKETTAVSLVESDFFMNPLSWVTNEPLLFPANSFIRGYAKFYLDLATSLSGQVCYSPKYNAFVRKPGASLPAVENLTSIGELRSLCRLVGPLGFRCIHHGLLLEASKRLGDVLGFCEANVQALEALVVDVQRLKNDRDHDALVRSLKGQGALLQACFSLGMVLKMRQLLRDAQRTVVAEKSPHLLRAIDSAHKLYNPNLLLEAELLPLDSFASDCGLEAEGGADQALVYLAKGSFSMANSHLVRLIPVAFATLFHHGVWSESPFISHLGAYANNLHLVALGMSQAITTLTSSMASTPEAVLQVPVNLELYLSSATNILFALSGGGPNKDSIFASWLDDSSEKFRSFPHMVFFLDFFLDSTCYVTRETLEKLLPYSLIRSMRQAVTQKNSQGNFF